MDFPFLAALPEGLRERAAGIRLACFDVDGTLTDGRIVFDEEGRESKAFHVHDGLGLRLLEEHDIRVVLVTARQSKVAAARARELRLSGMHEAVKDKHALLLELCRQHGIAPQAASMMGDDLVDLAALRAAGLAVAPADAHPWLRDQVHWRTHARAGAGAVRELCDLLLVAQGKAQAAVERFLG